ncbi:hypothetical protein NM688_g8791 [Phlebia brevispora]|uniref:Uncharacterized protein n=1 Tax=Phlebia brevispora TaxID=194682 RepID=A0ACC1RQN4_9APHY|nr:hypothetical protein NM688_g8791 [Phlebia brevispora]
MFAKPLQRWARSLATAAAEYPFSKEVLLPPAPPKPVAAPLHQGKGLMQYLSETLPTPDKQKLFATYFSKRHPDRIFPGTVLAVTLNHAPTSFTGVVTNIRRRGMDTSFVLRNVINRTDHPAAEGSWNEEGEVVLPEGRAREDDSHFSASTVLDLMLYTWQTELVLSLAAVGGLGRNPAGETSIIKAWDLASIPSNAVSLPSG